jgi:hypothetical protein
MTRLCSQTHIQAIRSGVAVISLVLQSNSLKLRSYKFNVIINIINIIFGLDIAVKLKTLKYNFIEKPNIFKFYFFI